jgi:hypothetical protein
MEKKVTKIVYNACFGGFGLSPVALKRYAELADLSYSEEVYEGAMTKFFASMHDKNGEYVSERDLSRNDPVLIQVVEELGKKANSRFSDLRIIELAPGTKYRIDEYDGNESIMTVDNYEWSVA